MKRKLFKKGQTVSTSQGELEVMNDTDSKSGLTEVRRLRSYNQVVYTTYVSIL